MIHGSCEALGWVGGGKSAREAVIMKQPTYVLLKSVSFLSFSHSLDERFLPFSH